MPSLHFAGLLCHRGLVQRWVLALLSAPEPGCSGRDLPLTARPSCWFYPSSCTACWEWSAWDFLPPCLLGPRPPPAAIPSTKPCVHPSFGPHGADPPQGQSWPQVHPLLAHSPSCSRSCRLDRVLGCDRSRSLLGGCWHWDCSVAKLHIAVAAEGWAEPLAGLPSP